jgi:hypothetical protein
MEMRGDPEGLTHHILVQSFLVLLLTSNQDLRWDIFLSYAGEDRAEVVRPLVELLERRGCHVWFDETQLSLGNSLRRKINGFLLQLSRLISI